ncbi:unnamed protein product [Cylindrotheca closterium]|uniref:Plastid lipid-associated protein/fibrillin conserved domain-containing protein n=1 Tax=Cylindrotheca closterium TaxID=2856 RepID=A0AAD2FR36_9STRA|nr:unnamed protein product [Cylindrotheca closterium]
MTKPYRTALSLLLVCLSFLLASKGVYSFIVPRNGALRETRSLFTSFQFEDESPEEPTSNRQAEFQNLEPVQESSIRMERKRKDKETGKKFVSYGDDLWRLRSVMNKLSRRLLDAISDGTPEVEDKVRSQLREIEQQDPELVYEMELKDLQLAKATGKTDDAERHGENAMEARGCIPAFNLEGLWVGKYGHHGYEMINVTYQGDQLIAYKVTGDKNVPKGEITFQVDLSPIKPKAIGSGKMDMPLQPISLTEKAAKKWGTKQLPRYRGLGHVAEPRFSNGQWMEGQLILISQEYFSFAWIPIETQIFFGRPSPELALKMLRENGVSASGGLKAWESPPPIDADVEVLKEFAATCLDLTTEDAEESLEGGAFSCIWHGVDTEECSFQ